MLPCVALAAAVLGVSDPAAVAGGASQGAAANWPVARVATLAGAGLDEDMRTNEINGRVWVGRPIIGGLETGDRAGWSAERYGAYDQRGLRVAVAVEPLFGFQTAQVGVINPWVVQNDRTHRRNPWSNPFTDAQDKLADRLEDARQQWLKDNNYVGGVRTFVNDATLWRRQGEAPKAQGDAGEITPRATIQINPAATKPARGFRVDAGPSRVPVRAQDAAAARAESGVRVSMPPAAPARGPATVASAAK